MAYSKGRCRFSRNELAVKVPYVNPCVREYYWDPREGTRRLVRHKDLRSRLYGAALSGSRSRPFYSPVTTSELGSDSKQLERVGQAEVESFLNPRRRRIAFNLRSY